MEQKLLRFVFLSSRSLLFTGLLLAGGVVTGAAQQTGSSWQGEWGSFQWSGPAEQTVYTGGRLTLSDCTGQTCKLNIHVAPTAANTYCDATGELSIHDERSAVAHLPGLEDEKCSMTFERGGTGSGSITTKQAGPDCNYFCMPGGSFTFTFLFRSRTLFAGSDLDACYAGDSRSRTAICADAGLASQERRWADLSYEVADLVSQRDGKSNDVSMTDAHIKKPLIDCESAAKPADCLAGAYTQGIAALEEQKRVWITAASTPGDPDQADALIGKIEGQYRRRFDNGDVQGDSFRSTDSMNIRRESKTSIQYSLELSFYNGHICSRGGIAEYRKNGSFVSHTKDVDDGECYFEIKPTEKGVSLVDPTGYCRQYDCGARGGYNGEDFTFAERVHKRPSAKPPAQTSPRAPAHQ